MYPSPAITFSGDTVLADYSTRPSDWEDEYLSRSAFQSQRRRSRDVVSGDEDGGPVTLTRIRQAVSAASMDHIQKGSIATEFPLRQSRPSSRSRIHDRSGMVSGPSSDYHQNSMLGSELHRPRTYTSYTHQRSSSTDSTDSYSSNSRSVASATTTLPSQGSSTSQRLGSRSRYTQSSDRYISRRTRPYASYYPKSTSTYSKYEFNNQAASWDSPPSSVIGTLEPSRYSEVLHHESSQTFYIEDNIESDYLTQSTHDSSYPSSTTNLTIRPSTEEYPLNISRTPSLTSTQNSPPSTPSSYSDSSFMTSTRLADYSTSPVQPTFPTGPVTHHTAPQSTTSERSLTRHFSRPRRFFRTKPPARIRADPKPTAVYLEQSLPDKPSEWSHHQYLSPPISPLTPILSHSLVQPSLQFPSRPESSLEITKRPIVPVRSSAPYAAAITAAQSVFSAGLSFGIPPPELGIRLASLESMAERQGILVVGRGSGDGGSGGSSGGGLD